MNFNQKHEFASTAGLFYYLAKSEARKKKMLPLQQTPTLGGLGKILKTILVSLNTTK